VTEVRRIELLIHVPYLAMALRDKMYEKLQCQHADMIAVCPPMSLIGFCCDTMNRSNYNISDRKKHIIILPVSFLSIYTYIYENNIEF